MTKRYQKIVDELMPEQWCDEDYNYFFDYQEVEDAIREGIKRGSQMNRNRKYKED